MAEASRSSNKPMTTAAFLQQLSQPKPTETKVDSSVGNIKPSLAGSLTVCQTQTSTSNMEGLSDADLQTLLQNFKDLCTDEQHSLISYLKKLEAKEPERVERLRKFVNLDAGSSTAAAATSSSSEKTTEKNETNDRSSPFSNRTAGANPTVDENEEKELAINEEQEKTEKSFAKIDSDDEDYSYEDVFKAARQNVKEKEEKEEKERNSAKTFMFKTEDFDLSNAKSLIANIMGQFKNANTELPSASNLLGLGVGTTQKPDIMPSTSLSQNMDNFPINLSNLADAIQIAQKAKPDFNQRPNVQNAMIVGQQHTPVGYYPNPPEISHGVPQIIKPHNLPHSNVGNPLQTVLYPQQNPYTNPNQPYINHPQYDRPSTEQQNRYPLFSTNNRDVNINSNMFNNRPRPNSYDNYGSNRW